MPPRYAYWTIMAGGLPTAFRAVEREELLPTFNRLKQKHPDAEMKYFARGRLWSSPEDAQREAETRRSVDRRFETPRGRDWRPGGEHRDPRQPFKDAKKDRNQRWRKERFEKREGFGKDRPRPDADRERPRAPRDETAFTERRPWGNRSRDGRKPFGAGERTSPDAPASARKPFRPRGERRPFPEPRRDGKPFSRPPQEGASRDRKPFSGPPRDHGSRGAKPFSGRPKEAGPGDRKPFGYPPREGTAPDRKPFGGRPRDGAPRDRKQFGDRTRDERGGDRKTLDRRPESPSHDPQRSGDRHSRPKPWGSSRPPGKDASFAGSRSDRKPSGGPRDRPPFGAPPRGGERFGGPPREGPRKPFAGTSGDEDFRNRKRAEESGGDRPAADRKPFARPSRPFRPAGGPPRGRGRRS